MEEPLGKIVAGDWNGESLAKERLAKKEVEKKLSTIRSSLAAFQRSKDYKGLVIFLDKATANDEALAKEMEWMKFMALCNGGDVEKGLELGAKLKKANWDNAGMLNRDAWDVVDTALTDVDPRVAKLAVEMATRANELMKEEQFQVLDTLAQAQFRAGDFAAAAASEEKAIKAFNDHVTEDSPAAKAYLKQFQDRLEKFQKATEKKDAA